MEGQRKTIAMSLPDDLLREVLSFLADTYRYTAAVDRQFRRVYQTVHHQERGRPHTTSYRAAVQTISTARIWLEEDEEYVREEGCDEAARYGRLDVLQFLRSSSSSNKDRPPSSCRWSAYTCERAAANGHLHVLQWLRGQGCEWDLFTCAAAAGGGHLQVLQWARLHGGDWNRYTCVWAAEHDHLPILQWARANGCDWNEDTCAAAAENGHLEILQWARDNGCKWNAETMLAAARGGHFAVLQWARANGCDWNKARCLSSIRRSIKWGLVTAESAQPILHWIEDQEQ
jgi:hypothetical protein